MKGTVTLIVWTISTCKCTFNIKASVRENKIHNPGVNLAKKKKKINTYNIHAFQKALQMHPTSVQQQKIAVSVNKIVLIVHNSHKISFGTL